MIIHQVPQGEPEWLRLRLGIPTASCFSEIITPKTLAFSKSSVRYMAQLIAEWISGAPVEDFENNWTRHGQDYEPQAREAYEFSVGLEVQQVGFVTRDDGMVGASPDGLVGTEGACELKCPKANTHALYLIGSGVDEKYMAQLQGQLWICEREWVDIQSYCPGFPTVVVRVNRNEEYIGKLATAVDSFVEVMLKTRERLTQEYGPFKPRDVKSTTDEYDGMGVSDTDIDVLIASGAIRPGA